MDVRGERVGREGESTAPTARPPMREAWPAEREARGLLTLRDSPDHSGSLRAMCLIQNGVLTFSLAPIPVSSRTRGAREANETKVVAQVPVKDLAVGLQRGRTNMFIVATRHQHKIYDEICCFADDQQKRNKWIAVFRRLGVDIHDWSEGFTVGRPLV
jgi:hypothetical protein